MIKITLSLEWTWQGFVNTYRDHISCIGGSNWPNFKYFSKSRKRKFWRSWGMSLKSRLTVSSSSIDMIWPRRLPRPKVTRNSLWYHHLDSPLLLLLTDLRRIKYVHHKLVLGCPCTTWWVQSSLYDWVEGGIKFFRCRFAAQERENSIPGSGQCGKNSSLHYFSW